MKALSLQPYWATEMFEGHKTIECRTWKTDYRGDILICASGNGKAPGLLCERAVIVAHLADIVPFTKEHLAAACLEKMPKGNCYAWIFDEFYDILPFRVKGKLHLFDVDDDLIKYVEFDSDQDAEKWLDNIIAPMLYKFQPKDFENLDKDYISEIFKYFEIDESIWN